VTATVATAEQRTIQSTVLPLADTSRTPRKVSANPPKTAEIEARLA
jgi:hypothetical protein